MAPPTTPTTPETLAQRFSESFAKSLADALEHGLLSHRRAAKLCGLTIDDLADLFAAYDINHEVLI